MTVLSRPIERRRRIYNETSRTRSPIWATMQRRTFHHTLWGAELCLSQPTELLLSQLHSSRGVQQRSYHACQHQMSVFPNGERGLLPLR